NQASGAAERNPPGGARGTSRSTERSERLRKVGHTLRKRCFDHSTAAISLWPLPSRSSLREDGQPASVATVRRLDHGCRKGGRNCASSLFHEVQKPTESNCSNYSSQLLANPHNSF